MGEAGRKQKPAKMPWDHVGFDVLPAKWEELVNFYSKALAPLAYAETLRIEQGVILGVNGKYEAELWIGKDEKASEQVNLHLAFNVKGMFQFPLS